jgi:hypothetical protein
MLSKRLGHDIKEERKKRRDEKVRGERERDEQVFY